MRRAGFRRIAALALLAGLCLVDFPAQAQPGLSIEDQIIALTNQARASRGLPPLTKNAQLSLAAIAHSRNMARLNIMTHHIGGGPGERARAAGYNWQTAAENVAADYHSAAQVVQAWMKSPGHRRNILAPTVTDIGVGVGIGARGRLFYCQVFARPRGK